MKKMLLRFAIVFSVVAIIISIVAGVKSFQFTNGCYSYLRLAGNAPTVERAEKFLKKVVTYIDKNNLDIGNSSFLIFRPTNDLDNWSGQMRAAYKIVADLSEQTDVSQLTKDNALMKIREVVGYVPDNIAYYPYQVFMIFFLAIFWILAIVFWIWLGILAMIPY
ncbi:MAG: hypothetical protein WC422_02195 [Candidatus Paceibacterota bacterium]